MTKNSGLAATSVPGNRTKIKENVLFMITDHEHATET